MPDASHPLTREDLVAALSALGTGLSEGAHYYGQGAGPGPASQAVFGLLQGLAMGILRAADSLREEV